jgi:hypothetical protein
MHPPVKLHTLSRRTDHPEDKSRQRGDQDKNGAALGITRTINVITLAKI